MFENYNELSGMEFLELMGMTYSETLESLEEITVKGADHAYLVHEIYMNEDESVSDSYTLMAFAGHKVYSLNFTQDIYDEYQKLDDEAYIYFIEHMIPNMTLGADAGVAG